MRPKLWSTGNWHLQHNNAPAHSSHLIQTFFGKKPDSCCLPGCLFSWYGSLRPLAVHQTQEATERKAISDKRGHYDCNDSRAKHQSERGFLRMFPSEWEKWSSKETTLRVIRFPMVQVCLFFSLPKLRYFSNRPCTTILSFPHLVTLDYRLLFHPIS